MAATNHNENKRASIFLKDKIDEKILDDILVGLGFTSIKTEVRDSNKSNIYYYYSIKRRNKETNIGIDYKNSCIDFYSAVLIKDKLSNIIKLLINEKVLDEASYKSGKYERNYSKYEADTDNIIEKIEFYYNNWLGSSIKEINNNIFNKDNKDRISDMIDLLSESISAFKPKYQDAMQNLAQTENKAGGIAGMLLNLKTNDNEKLSFYIKHFVKFIMDKYKEKSPLLQNKYTEYSDKCKSKIDECIEKVQSVKDLIKDFDYSSKSDYEKSCLKIEEDLAKCSENPKDADIVNKVNEIIDEINQVYKNVYYKKNNVSSLASYMGDEENIDLIERL